MTSPANQVERRVGQRFPYLLSVSFRQSSNSIDGVGFTQDLSSRGVFFFTDAALTEGSEIELTLRMPSEITLGESMPVRCRGRILRVVRPSSQSTSGSSHPQTKVGVAVRIEGYEYLADPESSATARVSTLHPRHDEDQPMAQSSARPIPARPIPG